MTKPSNKAMLITAILVFTGIINIFVSFVLKLTKLNESDSIVAFVETVFFVLGIITFIFAAGMFVYSRKYQEDQKRIKEINKAVKGKVVEVKYIDSISVLNQSPFELLFEYYVDGNRYTGKSDYLWEKPNIKVGSEIKVYIDSYEPKKYYVDNYELYESFQ